MVTKSLSVSTFFSQIFLPPALCDMTATSVQYIGLTLTYASSFQMLRGAVIIFTGELAKPRSCTVSALDIKPRGCHLFMAQPKIKTRKQSLKDFIVH